MTFAGRRGRFELYCSVTWKLSGRSNNDHGFMRRVWLSKSYAAWNCWCRFTTRNVDRRKSILMGTSRTVQPIHYIKATTFIRLQPIFAVEINLNKKFRSLSRHSGKKYFIPNSSMCTETICDLNLFKLKLKIHNLLYIKKKTYVKAIKWNVLLLVYHLYRWRKPPYNERFWSISSRDTTAFYSLVITRTICSSVPDDPPPFVDRYHKDRTVVITAVPHAGSRSRRSNNTRKGVIRRMHAFPSSLKVFTICTW